MPESSSCERCGVQFGCGAADRGCWCAELAVPPPAQRELSRLYRACLCPACLGDRAVADAAHSGAEPVTHRPRGD
ncbi:cysteine-rich CWC family protein [Baekduia sp.]|uniref:cysteine-rich CWC family protein n=1 Tax=Baekduia sp. TaxID=2600305 RepID=UPI0032C218CF